MINLTMKSNIAFIIKFKQDIRLLASKCRYYDNRSLVYNRRLCLSNVCNDWSEDQKNKSNKNNLLEYISLDRKSISIITNYDTKVYSEPKLGHHASRPLRKGIMFQTAISSLGTSNLNFQKPLGIREYSTAPENNFPHIIGIWKTISESAPVEYVQDSLICLHSFIGMPWWTTIVITAFITKMMVTFPLSLYQHYIIAKVENLKPEMDEIVKELRYETNFNVMKHGWPEKYARRVYNEALKKRWNELIVRDNCHPMKGLVLVLVQFPLWVTISVAFRNLCYMLPHYSPNAEQTYQELAVGGFGWITNLTDIDHFFVLPVLLGLINLAIIEIQLMLRVREPSKLQKYLTNFIRTISVVMVPIIAFVPSCMGLYWVCSSAFGLFYNLVVISPKIRRLVRIPKTNSEFDHPYAHLLLKIKYLLRLKTEE